MISNIFKSPLPSFSFHFKNGMTAVFMNGRFVTAEQSQIKELMEEIKQEGTNNSSHPYIYVDTDDKEIDSEALSPMEVVRLKAREEARRELLAEQELERARAMNINNVSNTQSDAFKTSLANSQTLSDVINAGTKPAGFVNVSKPAEPVSAVGVGVAAHNNPMASDVLVPTVTIPVNVPTVNGVNLQESAVLPMPADANMTDKLAVLKSLAAKKD